MHLIILTALTAVDPDPWHLLPHLTGTSVSQPLSQSEVAIIACQQLEPAPPAIKNGHNIHLGPATHLLHPHLPLSSSCFLEARQWMPPLKATPHTITNQSKAHHHSSPHHLQDCSLSGGQTHTISFAPTQCNKLTARAQKSSLNSTLTALTAVPLAPQNPLPPGTPNRPINISIFITK